MWVILRLPCRCVHVDICVEDKDDMILRIKIIRYLCRLNFASWIPQLRTYGSELGWYVGFKLGFSVDMVPGAHVVSPLGYSINMLLVLAIENSFGTWEGYLVGDSLGLPFISPLDSPNHLADLPGTLLVTPLGLWFGSDVVGGGVVISYVPPSGAFITSIMNAVRSFQLMELLTLFISATWLIPTSGGR